MDARTGFRSHSLKMKTNVRLPRKIWIGQDTRGASTCWHVGQIVRIGHGDDAPKGKVSQIVLKDNGWYEVWVLKDKHSFVWKEGNMPVTVEYLTDYE